MINRVTPKSHSRQPGPKQSDLLELVKLSQDLSYSSSPRFDESNSERLKHQSLVVRVNRSCFPRTEATERGLRAIFDEDVSISQIKPLPPQQDVDKPLIASAEPEEDVLDWDFYLKAPPPRSTGTIELKFKYGGRSKPIPVTDPWDE